MIRITKYILSVLILLSSTGLSAQNRKILEDKDFAQMVLLEKGQSLKISAHKSNQVELKEPVRSGRIFWTPRYILVHPDTEYGLNYVASGKDCSRLVFVVEEYDNSRKNLKSFTCHIEEGDRQLQFITSPYAKYVRVIMNAEQQLDGPVSVHEITMEQLSKSFRYSKEKKLLKKKGPAMGETLSVDYRTPQHLSGYNLGLRMNLPKTPGNAVILFKWFYEGKEAAAIRCVLSNFKGVQKQWDGIRVEWFRNWKYAPEGMSMKMQHLFYADLIQKESHLDYQFRTPFDSDHLEVSIEKSTFAQAIDIYIVEVKSIL